jgi:hypothetical protein
VAPAPVPVATAPAPISAPAPVPAREAIQPLASNVSVMPASVPAQRQRPPPMGMGNLLRKKQPTKGSSVPSWLKPVSVSLLSSFIVIYLDNLSPRQKTFKSIMGKSHSPPQRRLSAKDKGKWKAPIDPTAASIRTQHTTVPPPHLEGGIDDILAKYKHSPVVPSRMTEVHMHYDLDEPGGSRSGQGHAYANGVEDILAKYKFGYGASGAGAGPSGSGAGSSNQRQRQAVAGTSRGYGGNGNYATAGAGSGVGRRVDADPSPAYNGLPTSSSTGVRPGTGSKNNSGQNVNPTSGTSSSTALVTNQPTPISAAVPSSSGMNFALNQGSSSSGNRLPITVPPKVPDSPPPTFEMTQKADAEIASARALARKEAGGNGGGSGQVANPAGEMVQHAAGDDRALAERFRNPTMVVEAVIPEVTVNEEASQDRNEAIQAVSGDGSFQEEASKGGSVQKPTKDVGKGKRLVCFVDLRLTRRTVAHGKTRKKLQALRKLRKRLKTLGRFRTRPRRTAQQRKRQLFKR